MPIIIPTPRKDYAVYERLALRKIFERLSPEEDRDLGEFLEVEPRRVDLSDKERRKLKSIVGALIKNEKGYFKEVKDNLARTGIHWSRMWRGGL